MRKNRSGHRRKYCTEVLCSARWLPPVLHPLRRTCLEACGHRRLPAVRERSVPEKPSARKAQCPKRLVPDSCAATSVRVGSVVGTAATGALAAGLRRAANASLIGTGSIFARCLAADNHWRSAPGLALAGRCICAAASRDAGGHGGPLTALVRIALRRPYTFVVLAILILLRGAWRSCARRSTSFPRSAFR